MTTDEPTPLHQYLPLSEYADQAEPMDLPFVIEVLDDNAHAYFMAIGLAAGWLDEHPEDHDTIAAAVPRWVMGMVQLVQKQNASRLHLVPPPGGEVVHSP